MKSSVSKLPQAKVEPAKPVDEVEKANEAVGEVVNEVEPVAPMLEVKLDSVMIELPLLPIEGYVRKRVDVTFTSAEAQALKSVKNALEAKSVQLANGKHVTSISDALRWIVQQITA